MCEDGFGDAEGLFEGFVFFDCCLRRGEMPVRRVWEILSYGDELAMSSKKVT